MRSWLKALVVVAVTLPIAAYVVATLGASPAQPTEHDPVILREPTPSSPPATASPDQEREGDQDDDVRVVTPSPKRVGEDDGPDDGPEDGPDDDGPGRERDETDDDTTDDGDD